jgi:hypothetical protein
MIVPARTMAGIDSSQNCSMTRRQTTSELASPLHPLRLRPLPPAASIDANTLRERIGRNRKDVLREVFNKPLGIHLHAPLIRLAIALSPRCTETLTSDSPIPAPTAASATLFPSIWVSRIARDCLGDSMLSRLSTSRQAHQTDLAPAMVLELY